MGQDISVTGRAGTSELLRDMGGSHAQVVASAGRLNWRTSFSKVRPTVDPTAFTQIAKGAGQGVTQAGGNLLVTTGTAANEEVILRSTRTFSGSLRAMWHAILSQRIANQLFFIELVDLIGDALAFTVNSATSVTVTFPASIPNPFTSENIGQAMNIGALTLATAVPGRYAIASVAGQTVTFTVAGWPATGAGTCSLFGWNYHRVEYSGTLTTNAIYDTQRNGWNNGNPTVAVTNPAAPGHVGIMMCDDQTAGFMDQPPTSVAGVQTTMRASRVLNVPEDGQQLYLQIRVRNGSVAPATTTTFTVGMCAVSDFTPQPVSIEAVRPQTTQTGTVVSLNPLTNLMQGPVGHDAVLSGNPFRVAGRAATANFTPVATGDVCDIASTVVGAAIQKPFSIPEAEWSFPAPAGGIITAADVLARAAGAAGIRNYVTGMDISNNSAVPTEFVIKDGAAIIHRVMCPANMPVTDLVFPNPLKGTAATALNVACITGGAAVYVNLQGYSAP